MSVLSESFVPAAVRYKEITATADSAAQRLRAEEAARAARLEADVVDARAAAAETDRQYDEAVDELRKRWSMAMSALWEEKWLQVTRMPAEDLTATPTTFDKAVRSAHATFLELHESLSKTKWSPASLLRGRKREE